MLTPLTLVLEFARAPHAGSYGLSSAQDYLLRTPDGGFQHSPLAWNEALLADLAAVRLPQSDPGVRQRLGETLRRFLLPLGWEGMAAQILQATQNGQRIDLQIRSTAAELYALPWELLTLAASGQPVGALPGVQLRFAWPDATTTAEPPIPEANRGRHLLAQSTVAESALRTQQAEKRQRTRRLSAGLVLIGGLLALSMIIAGYARTQKRVATDALCRDEDRALADLVEIGRQLLVDKDQPIEALLWFLRAKQRGAQSPLLPELLREATRPLDAVQRVLGGHTDRVNSASYSPDGSRIVTASKDKTARVWDAHSGQLLAPLKGHSRAVESASYSPDGSRIVTASKDKTARIWDAHSGQLLTTLTGHADALESASYSPDASRIVTASGDKTARVWDAHSGQLLTTLTGHSAAVYSASYSPDGSRIVTASADQTARVWDAHSGQLLTTLTGHSATVYSASYSPNGSRIVTASWDKTARVWDADSSELLATLWGHAVGVTSASYSPDGSRIVTTSADQTARIWDADSRLLLTTLRGHSDGVTSASYSPDQSRIVTASKDQTVRVWDADNSPLITTLTGHSNCVNSARYSPDQSRIVTASADKSAGVFDARSGQLLTILRGHSDPIISASYSPDGSRIVTASADKTARVWDARSGKLLTTLEGHADAVNSASYSPDASRIVTASADHTARVFDARSGQLLTTLRGHADAVNSASYSPDASRIVTASSDDTGRIWDVRSGQLLLTLHGHLDTVHGASYSPNGKRIVTASADGTARVFDAHSGQLLLILRGHSDIVASASYSPDGNRILTASFDRTARVFDAHSGQLLTRLLGHARIVTSASYSGDASRIVTASCDQTARIWDVAPETRSAAELQSLLECRSEQRLQGDLVVSTPAPGPPPACDKLLPRAPRPLSWEQLNAPLWAGIRALQAGHPVAAAAALAKVRQRIDSFPSLEYLARLTVAEAAVHNDEAAPIPAAVRALPQKINIKEHPGTWYGLAKLMQDSLYRPLWSVWVYGELQKDLDAYPWFMASTRANMLEAQLAAGLTADVLRTAPEVLALQTQDSNRAIIAALAWVAARQQTAPQEQRTWAQRAFNFYAGIKDEDTLSWSFSGSRHAFLKQPDSPARTAALELFTLFEQDKTTDTAAQLAKLLEVPLPSKKTPPR